MGKTVEAIFDGKVFQTDEPVELQPNTRVRIFVETLPSKDESVMSFLHTARGLNLDGPPDWSMNLDSYFYDGKDLDGK